MTVINTELTETDTDVEKHERGRKMVKFTELFQHQLEARVSTYQAFDFFLDSWIISLGLIISTCNWIIVCFGISADNIVMTC